MFERHTTTQVANPDINATEQVIRGVDTVTGDLLAPLLAEALRDAAEHVDEGYVLAITSEWTVDGNVYHFDLIHPLGNGMSIQYWVGASKQAVGLSSAEGAGAHG